jgi:hypothetical protein
MRKDTVKIRYDLILGSRRFSNYAWALLSLIGGVGFLLAGLSSYLGVELLPFANTNEIVFIPQGIVMTFYGSIGSLLSLFLTVIIVSNVGGGYTIKIHIERCKSCKIINHRRDKPQTRNLSCN